MHVHNSTAGWVGGMMKVEVHIYHMPVPFRSFPAPFV